MSEALKNQRTYALVGHSGCGKTSTAEMLLFNTGVIDRLGKIEEGTTALDNEPEEIKRRGSIQPGFAGYKWKKNNHYLIDTPGDPNFCGDLPYSLTASDGVIFTIDAVDGVKPLSRKVWAAVEKAELPTVIFINKMDRDRADFDFSFNSLNSALGISPVLLQYPIGSKENFKGIVDMLSGTAYMFEENGKMSKGEIPDDIAEEIEILRETMIENIAESDEELMEKYLEVGELTPDEITQGLSLGVKNRTIFPVCLGSAIENKGGSFLLDMVQTYLPSPLEHPDWKSEDGSTRASDPDAPVACFVFKTLADPFAGQLTLCRVLSGTVSGDLTLINPGRESKERLGTIQLLNGKDQRPVKDPVGPGAIITLAKLKETFTGDTLCDEKSPFEMIKPNVAPQLITFALAPAEKGEEDKVFQAIMKLLVEDINLTLSRDEESGDILLSGMGQNHIEISVEKARRRYKTDIILKTPKVPYRETIKGSAEVQGRYKKQSGGRGQFGDCWIKLEPLEKGAGYEFVNAIVGGVIPKQYIPAVDKGVQESAAKGILAGAPIIDFKVTLYDGTYHAVDSSEMAFKVAGSMAFKKACETAGISLLEPLMNILVEVPDEFMGDIIGDLSSRRGKVLGSGSTSGVTEVKAHVPMSEILQYAPDLRSMTGGQGTFTMELSHYEECPSQIAEKIISDRESPADA
ncbi:elongation factor G [Maridesulfovibrio ferrireducens]|uniref:Elongation factor G n=1 Tax=Maridesulfovibrio ferrireducens TaxID=246191 RepID=A0A1G9GV70_9BACT|nr:elongation factor G [Maridesulfovibrio ferrireducens]SDL04494.1 elongation factor G [Maridesulfovibrio ferrireducens]